MPPGLFLSTPRRCDAGTDVRLPTVSTLEFIAAVAWPLAALVIAVLYRRAITAILSGQVGRMRAGPLEVEWRRTLSEVEAELPRFLDRPLPKALTRVVPG